jgi:hypothetical protein
MAPSLVFDYKKFGHFAVRFTLLLALVASMGSAQPPRQRISLEEARKLAYEVVKVHNPGAELNNSPRSFDPDFYFFAATWPNPNGSPIIGYFAVNPWTGDVWNSAGCEHFTSKALAKLQQGIRARLQVSRAEFVKLRAKKPMCGTD